MKVTIRKFRESDKERAFAFLKSIFAGWQTLQQWRWKFELVEEALGQKATIWVVEDNSRIVGHVACIPMKLRVGDEVFPVCQLVDGALSSQYRHGGIYKTLVQRVLQDAQRAGCFAIFGFANRPSHRVYTKIQNIRSICLVEKMFKVLSLANALKTLKPSFTKGQPTTSEGGSQIRDMLPTLGKKAIPTLLYLLRDVGASMISCLLLGGIKRERGESATRPVEVSTSWMGFERTWSRLSKKYRFAFERDGNYLRWRYGNPKTKYQICSIEKSDDSSGYAVITSEEVEVNLGPLRMGGLKVGYIVDLIANQELMTPLLSIAEEALKKQNACVVNCWTTDNSPLQNILRGMRYYQIPREIGKVTFIASVHALCLEGVVSSERIGDTLIALGDSDLI